MSELAALLTGKKPGERGWRCPDEMLLAGYADGRLRGRDLERVERHVADCRHCLDQLGFLATAPAPEEAVPPELLARARDLAKPPAAAPAWRWGAAAATAACGLLAVSVWVNRPPAVPVAPVAAPAPAIVQPQPVAPPVAPAPQAPARAVRSSSPRALLPELLLPPSHSPVALENLEFRWREVPGSVFYDIRVVTADGDPVWEERVNGTSVRPPPSAGFGAGRKYFVWVRAHLVGGKTVPARAVPFSIQ